MKREFLDNALKNLIFVRIFRAKESSGLTKSGLKSFYCSRFRHCIIPVSRPFRANYIMSHNGFDSLITLAFTECLLSHIGGSVHGVYGLGA